MQRSKYRILGLVGQGQFGRVFCAIHRQTGSLVALKELERQRFSTRNFLRELRFLLSLQHPNIVTCQALEHTQTGRYLVMDYCEGGTLRNLIQSEVQLSLVQSLKLIADILAGLAHAHSRGIVHCDIKPENILLSLDTTGWTARISDFGIARLTQELGCDRLGDTGSPAYMAPERFYGQYSPSSDLYAVGVLLFELVVGHRPFSGLPGELMTAHLNQPVKVPDTVPFLLRSTISTALQKLPARRFASAAEMLTSIQLAAEVEILTQRRTSPHPSITPSHATSLNGGNPRTRVAPHHPIIPTISNAQLQTLQTPVTSLAVESQQVYQANGSQVSCKTYASDAVAGDNLHQWLVQLTAPVQALMLRPQGCFALTISIPNRGSYPPASSDIVAHSRTQDVFDSNENRYNSFIYSLYCLPRTQIPTLCSLERYQLLTVECMSLATAIDPQGRWIAIATTTESGLSGQTTFQILKLPNLQPIQPPQNCLPSQLIALDSRHGIAISNQLGDDGASVGTVFEIFTRRGSFIGTLKLPMSLSLVTLSATVPYRLLAIEKNNQTALLIDLKPFKVFGIRLEIEPAFVVATCWGYILADKFGKIVLLDRDGQRIGDFMVPAAPSAIATFADYGVLIATWSGNQGTLYRVDLRQLHQNFVLKKSIFS